MSAWDDVPIYGTDREWFDYSGNCGGCGMDGCHGGTPCEDQPDRLRVQAGVCGECPTRKATGQVP